MSNESEATAGSILDFAINAFFTTLKLAVVCLCLLGVAWLLDPKASSLVDLLYLIKYYLIVAWNWTLALL